VGNSAKPRAATRLAAGIVLVLGLTIILVAGCGASTPQQAVNNFYKAIEAHNWNTYLDSVLPNNVRRMTESDITSQKKKFKEVDYKYSGLQYKTVIDKKDPNTAEVELTSGTITGTNPSTGQKESTTIAEIKKSYGITPTVKVQKYKGSWYVNTPLASADVPAQQQPSQ